jgi:hypothetical protein
MHLPAKKPLGSILAWGVFALATVHFILFGYFLFQTAIMSPISDMFAYLDAYIRFRAGEVSWVTYLWRAHGEHHLLWIRLLTWADVEVFHTRGIPFMAAATAAIAATALLLWHHLRRAQAMADGPTSLALLAPMLIMSTANVTDVSVPINTTYPITVFFVVLAIVLFAYARNRAWRANYQRMAALLAAFGASLATAAGLLVWPILFWIAWRERLSRTWLATLACLGIVYILFYARDLHFIGLAPTLETGAASFLSPEHLSRVADYCFAFLGLPSTREPALALVGRALGVTLFLAGLSAVVIATFSERLSTPFNRIAVGMILLALGSAALAALGRGDLIDEVKVPVRYTLFATALPIGLLFILLPRAACFLRSPRGRVLQATAGLLLAGLLLIQQLAIGRAAARIAQAIAREADCFAQGTYAEPISPTVTRIPQEAQRVLQILRQQGLLAPRLNDCPMPAT